MGTYARRYVPFDPVPVVETVEVEHDVGQHADEEEAVGDKDEEQRWRREASVGEHHVPERLKYQPISARRRWWRSNIDALKLVAHGYDHRHQ